MTYVKTYSGTKTDMLREALNDAKEYLGDKYPMVESILKDNIEKHGIRKTIKCYRFILSFAGVEGLPAKAIMINVLKGAL